MYGMLSPGGCIQPAPGTRRMYVGSADSWRILKIKSRNEVTAAMFAGFPNEKSECMFRIHTPFMHVTKIQGHGLTALEDSRQAIQKDRAKAAIPESPCWMAS